MGPFCSKCIGGGALTEGGLVVLQMLPSEMPDAAPAHGATMALFGAA